MNKNIIGKRFYPTPDNTWQYGDTFKASTHTWDIKNWLGLCPQCGSRTFTYGGGWACVKDYCRHSVGSIVCNNGSEPSFWEEDINVQMDGNSWVATYGDFIDLQESVAGFGDTPIEAVNNLKKEKH